MKTIWFIIGTTFLAASVNAQQPVSCGIAQQQLQGYVSQVNQVANWEYMQGIPMRCGYNGQCAQWWLSQLNMWYAQQAQLVNGWYQQIAMQCAGQSSPGQIAQNDEDLGGGEPIDEGAIEDMDIDDEDKTVRIKIPSNPKGFKPRR